MSISYNKQEEECLAISYALKILKAGFSEAPQIDGILYIDMVPEVVRTLLKTQLDYRQTQIRIYHIAKNTGLSIDNVRKLMKTKTLSELEAFKKVGGKIVFHDLIKIEKAE